MAKLYLSTLKPMLLASVLLCHSTNHQLIVNSEIYRSILMYTNSLVSKGEKKAYAPSCSEAHPPTSPPPPHWVSEQVPTVTDWGGTSFVNWTIHCTLWLQWVGVAPPLSFNKNTYYLLKIYSWVGIGLNASHTISPSFLTVILWRDIVIPL